VKAAWQVQPRTVAIWLLERVAVPEALIGDLDEGRRAGRSRRWFARQAAVAIVQTVARQCSMATISTALVASALLFVWFEGALKLYSAFLNSLHVESRLVHPRLFYFVWIIYCLPLNTGWCAGCAVTGWLVARLHRGHPAAVGLMTAAVQLPVVVWFGWPYLRLLVHVEPPFSPLLSDHVGYLFDTLIAFVGMPLCTLIGGLLASGRTPIRATSR
jgi:hypothetical protein